MTLEGCVKNGAIVLEPATVLPEGTRVRVEVISPSDEPTLFDRIGYLAGRAKNLPPDAAEQHDHYLYGRCDICGKPASQSRLGSMFCENCRKRYDEYQCARCGQRVVILREIEHSDICNHCDLRAKINGLPEEQREAIRRLVKSGKRLAAIKEAVQILGISLGDAAFLAEELKR